MMMFISLTFFRPSRAASPYIFGAHAAFHGFTAVAMGNRIGHSFPAAMICAEVVFLPLDNGDDASLIVWLKRLFSGSPKLQSRRVWARPLAIIWILVQIGLPLRMRFVSRGEEAYTAEGYRWSWTMMLHSKSSMPFGGRVPLFNLHPKCEGVSERDGAINKWIDRKDYMPNKAVLGQDPHTIPLPDMLGLRGFVAVTTFPRQLTRVSAEIGTNMNEVCKPFRAAVYGTVYTQINDVGPYVRTVDPTVDLAAVGQYNLKNRTTKQMLLEVVQDGPTDKSREFLLYGLAANFSRETSDSYYAKLKEEGGARAHPEMVLDRSPCLSAKPFKMYPMNNPIGIIGLRSPRTLLVTSCESPGGPCKTDTIKASETFTDKSKLMTKAFSVEITIKEKKKKKKKKKKKNEESKKREKSCADSPEDVLFALFVIGDPK